MAVDKFLIWDFDGTLAHRPGQWSGTVHAVLQRAGLDNGIDREAVRPFCNAGFPWHTPERVREPGQSADDWWRELVPVLARAFTCLAGVSDELATQLAWEVRRTYLDASAWVVFEDVVPTLNQLTALQWRHIVLSNHVPELPVMMEQLGLSAHFQAVHTSAATGVEKPNAAAFRRVLATLPPDAKVWMVGDNPVADAEGAEAAGIPAILVRHDTPSFGRRCGSLADIIAIVEP